MYRTNTPQDVVDTGVVQVDAGDGVHLSVPLTPPPAGVPTDHPMLYMSGVRNVAGGLLAGWSPAGNGVTISRQGATVTLALDVTWNGGDLVPPGQGGTDYADLLPIPTGFAPIGTGFIAPMKSGSTSPRPGGWYDRVVTNIRIRDFDSTFPTGKRITNVVTWQTRDPIPTSLPGIPA